MRRTARRSGGAGHPPRQCRRNADDVEDDGRSSVRGQRLAEERKSAPSASQGTAVQRSAVRRRMRGSLRVLHITMESR